MATITDNDLKMFQKRAKTAFASRCDTGGIAWDSVIWDLCNEVRRLRSASNERANCAKLREAAETALKTIRGVINSTISPRSNTVFDCRDKLSAALAAPARNCDVDSTEGQTRRYEDYCRAHTKVGGCTGCPLAGCRRCQIAWAQLPDTEGGAK